MKSAMLLSKTDDLFDKLERYLQSYYNPIHGASYGITLRSIRLDIDGDRSFILYDRDKEPDIFERYEIPEIAVSAGYRYGYLVECRSEDLFCRIIRGIAVSIDVMICDSDGVLFKPDQVSPDSIAL